VKVSGKWLTDPATQSVLSMLTKAGFQAYAVGGCVRNTLLGVPVADVDIATSAHPEQVVTLAKAAGLKSVPTGIEHGTVTIVCNRTGFEVTTFRRDVKTDGRRAVVAFTGTIAVDAHRRDFTINALYVAADGTLFDPLHGLADIKARRVKFIDNAHDRIREDYLRILRFFRFHAWYGVAEGGIDADALAACAELAEGIKTLSKERIGAEMTRLLAAPDPAPAMAAMAITGILARVLPGANPASLGPLVHVETMAGLHPDPMRRLAALGGENAAGRWRLSKSAARRLKLLSGAIGSPAKIAELAYRYGAPFARDIALLRAALMQVPLPDDLETVVAHAAAQVFPVRAADLMPDVQGLALGARLDRLKADWIASGFVLTRAQLLN